MMTIKNNSSETKQAVLLRFAAFVPDHALSSGNFNENYDGTSNSVWGYIPRDSLVKKLDCGRSCNLAPLGSSSRRIT